MHALSKVKQTKKTVLVKIGGSVLSMPACLHDFIADIKAAHKQGIRLAIVHGGGPEIDQQLAAKGILPKKHNGLRITDAQTLAIVVEALSFINELIVDELAKAGVKAIAFTPAQPLFCGEKLYANDSGKEEIDLGYVGQITSTNIHALYAAFADGQVPVIMPIAVDRALPHVLNVNADHAAMAVASVLNANKFIYVTDVAGVLSDPSNSSSSIPNLRAAEAIALLASGAIGGGMKPKLQSCVDAIKQGVPAVQIINGKEPHGLFKAISNYFIGTTISR